MDAVAGGPADDGGAGALLSDGRGLESLNGSRPGLTGGVIYGCTSGAFGDLTTSNDHKLQIKNGTARAASAAINLILTWDLGRPDIFDEYCDNKPRSF
jgi:hypothetical protein